ncbi:MAG: periplasmic heavy metal sensor, partial [Verrucomicrobiae bacterium]|nr:periplasmic heavy metal sensor [Verrucomicrobiae bacterium]
MALYRKIIVVIFSLVVLVCLYAGVFHWMTADTAQAMKAERPELEWLRLEYNLDEEQFSEIRAKHEAHDIVCRDLCRRLVEARKQLDRAINEEGTMSPVVSAALAQWTEQRQRCREATLEHMYDVSSVMSPEAAKRYRERIFRQ